MTAARRSSMEDEDGMAATGIDVVAAKADLHRYLQTGRDVQPADANPVTLHRILVHVATETHRHAGHARLHRTGRQPA